MEKLKVPCDCWRDNPLTGECVPGVCANACLGPVLYGGEGYKKMRAACIRSDRERLVNHGED